MLNRRPALCSCVLALMVLATACAGGATSTDHSGNWDSAAPDTGTSFNCEDYDLESFILDYETLGCAINEICVNPGRDIGECAERAADSWLGNKECIDWDTEGMSCGWWACIEAWREVVEAIRDNPEVCETQEEAHPGETYGRPLECEEYAEHISECGAVDCYG